ncbi:PAAR domain-containing protein [Achromobacter aloeverae]
MGERAIIREGDTTSHGGRVLEGQQIYTIDGRAVAGVGHLVFCPLCKGSFAITDDLQGRRYPHRIMGRDTAVEGMRTECGAILIASQSTATIMHDGEGQPVDAVAASATSSPGTDSALCLECLQDAADSGAVTVARD